MADAQLVVDVVLNLVDRTMKAVSASVNTSIAKTGTLIDKIKTKFDKWTNSIDLSFLSLLFGGMMLKRIFLDTAVTLISGYKEMSTENNLFKQSVEKLGGAFDYLKYSIVNGWANSEFTQKVIKKITDAIINLGDYLDDHPDIGEKLIDISIGIGAFGLAMMGLGQLKQIVSAGGTLASFFRIMEKGLVWLIPDIEILLGFLTTPFAIASSFFIVGGIFSEWREKINKFLDKFGWFGDLLRIIGNTLAIFYNYLYWIVHNIDLGKWFRDAIMSANPFLQTIKLIYNIIREIGKAFGMDWSLDSLANLTEKANEATYNWSHLSEETKLQSQMDITNQKLMERKNILEEIANQQSTILSNEGITSSTYTIYATDVR